MEKWYITEIGKSLVRVADAESSQAAYTEGSYWYQEYGRRVAEERSLLAITKEALENFRQAVQAQRSVSPCVSVSDGASYFAVV